MAAVSAEAARRWQRRADVLWHESLGGVVLLPPEATDPFAVSAPAALLWEALAAPRDVDELAAAMSEPLGVPAAEVAEALPALLDELAGLGALREDP